MGYNDKYPDMSAMYAVQFEYENKLKDKIKELETDLERTRKALEIIKKEMSKETMPDFAVISDALKSLATYTNKQNKRINNDNNTTYEILGMGVELCTYRNFYRNLYDFCVYRNICRNNSFYYVERLQ